MRHALFLLVLLFGAHGNLSAAEITSQKIDENTALIEIAGEISIGDERKFLNVALNFDRAIVVLNSPGGALTPGLDIGRTINLKGFVTLVPENAVCASSCALIWLAGEKRMLAPTAQLGFHASYVQEGGRKVESGVANALIGHYLSRLNLPSRAVIFATSAPPDSILWLTLRNMDQSGIPFEVFDHSSSRGKEPLPSEDSSQPVQSAVPALWKIGDHDTEIFILGTTGLISDDLGWFSGEIERAFYASDELLLEDDDGGSESESRSLATLPRGSKTLRELMGTSDRMAYEQALKSFGWNVSSFDRLKPWAATFSIALQQVSMMGIDESRFLIPFLQSRAQNKKISGILHPHDHFRRLDSLPLSIQLGYLREHVEQIPLFETAVRRGQRFWEVGDPSGYAQFLRQGDLAQRLHWEFLVVEGNRKIATALSEKLETPGVIFAVIDFSRFEAPDGVPSQLEGIGIEVTRVQ